MIALRLYAWTALGWAITLGRAALAAYVLAAPWVLAIVAGRLIVDHGTMAGIVATLAAGIAGALTGLAIFYAISWIEDGDDQ